MLRPPLAMLRYWSDDRSEATSDSTARFVGHSTADRIQLHDSDGTKTLKAANKRKDRYSALNREHLHLPATTCDLASHIPGSDTPE